MIYHHDYDYTNADGKHYMLSQVRDIFEEWLDELYGDVNVAGYPFSAGRALRELDEIAFNEEFWGWMHSEKEDGNWFEYGDYPEDEDEDEDEDEA